jgi:hypothetical protein
MESHGTDYEGGPLRRGCAPEPGNESGDAPMTALELVIVIQQLAWSKQR